MCFKDFAHLLQSNLGHNGLALLFRLVVLRGDYNIFQRVCQPELVFWQAGCGVVSTVLKCVRIFTNHATVRESETER
jgi:hypothetical protein